jgi:hypothetical protein
MARRSSDHEQTAPRERVRGKGVAMYDAALTAVRDEIGRRQHRDRVSATAQRVLDAHTDALDRLAR